MNDQNVKYLRRVKKEENVDCVNASEINAINVKRGTKKKITEIKLLLTLKRDKKKQKQ